MAAHNPPANPGHPTGHQDSLATGHDDHHSPIKTPKQLITVVVLSFIVPIVVIIMLAKFVASATLPNAGTDSMSDQSIRERLRPVAGFELRPADGSGAARSPDEVYKATCSACHTAGVAGAPKTGDAASWSARIAQGAQALVQSALKGKGAMPAQAGGDFSDFEIERTVVMMANKAGGNLPEPAQPGAKPAEGAEAKPAGSADAKPADGGAQAGAKPAEAAPAQPAAAPAQPAADAAKPAADAAKPAADASRPAAATAQPAEAAAVKPAEAAPAQPAGAPAGDATSDAAKAGDNAGGAAQGGDAQEGALK